MAFHTRLMLMLSAILIACVIAFPACRSRNTDIPEQLMGVWTTTEPRYQDRYFEFTKYKSMRVGKGDGTEESYPIVNIEETPQNALKRYTITYLSEGEEYYFHFTYDAFDTGIIRFTNQDNLRWYKKEPAE